MLKMSICWYVIPEPAHWYENLADMIRNVSPSLKPLQWQRHSAVRPEKRESKSHHLLDSRKVPFKTRERQWQMLKVYRQFLLGLKTLASSYGHCWFSLLLSWQCTSSRQAEDRGTAMFASFMYIWELLEYLCFLWQTCATARGEASVNHREHCVLLSLYKIGWLMISCEQSQELLNLLGCSTTNFPALPAFHCCTLSGNYYLLLWGAQQPLSTSVLTSMENQGIKKSAEPCCSTLCLLQQLCPSGAECHFQGKINKYWCNKPLITQ